MAKICFILIAGLDASLLSRATNLKNIVGKQTPIKPPFPAVTCTVQATLSTGVAADKHGIIANGLYTFDRRDLQAKLDLGDNTAEYRKQTSFWEQSNALLESPRFWKGSGKKVAMLFWQNSMPINGAAAAADIIITPKPEHTADGKTLTACWSQPANLYAEQAAKFGPFPLHNYWSPMAGLPSSQWIINSAIDVWQNHSPDLQLVYIPHLDYCLQKFGPSDERCLAELAALDAALEPLLAAVRASGGVPILAGDYAMSDVGTPVAPNAILRRAELLVLKVDEAGKKLIDYAKSTAFAMCDHQIAHVYTTPAVEDEVVATLSTLPGIERVYRGERIAKLGLANKRTGNIVALAQSDAWFVHDYWANDGEKPAWQFSVDIHRKPGYDPRELFFDPVKKCIAQSAALVKGSHGRVSEDAKEWPVLLCDEAIAPKSDSLEMTAIAGWLKSMLA